MSCASGPRSFPRSWWSAGPAGKTAESLQKLLEREAVITDAGPPPVSCVRPS